MHVILQSYGLQKGFIVSTLDDTTKARIKNIKSLTESLNREVGLLPVSKVYELPLTRDYVSEWGVIQAVREILQNAIDNPNQMKCEYRDDRLCISSLNTSLQSESLVLGATTKLGDDDKIGSFGEGYKIAILVLTRLGKPVTIYNQTVHWKAEFRRSKVFGNIETLHIYEYVLFGGDDCLTFAIEGITPEEYAEVVDSCLQLQPDVGHSILTKFGSIMMDKPGKLYVNGLFVCDTELSYGYDIMPAHIKLERDRQTVDSFNLKLCVADMWMDTKQYDTISDMLLKEVKDIEYVQYRTTPELSSNLVTNFDAKYNGKVAVSDEADVQHMSECGINSTVIVPAAVKSILDRNFEYKSRIATMSTTKPTPQSILQTYYDDYKGCMSNEAQEELERLIEESSGWSIDR